MSTVSVRVTYRVKAISSRLQLQERRCSINNVIIQLLIIENDVMVPLLQLDMFACNPGRVLYWLCWWRCVLIYISQVNHFLHCQLANIWPPWIEWCTLCQSVYLCWLRLPFTASSTHTGFLLFTGRLNWCILLRRKDSWDCMLIFSALLGSSKSDRPPLDRLGSTTILHSP